MVLFHDYVVNSARNSASFQEKRGVSLTTLMSGESATMLTHMDLTSEKGTQYIQRYVNSIGDGKEQLNLNVTAALAMNQTLPLHAAQRIASFRDITFAEALLSADNIRGTELEQVSPTDLCMCNLERIAPELKDEEAEADIYSWHKYMFEKLAEEAGVSSMMSSRSFNAYQERLDDYRYFFFHSSTTFAGFDALLPIALGNHGHECIGSDDERAARKKLVRMHSEKLGKWYAKENDLEAIPASWVTHVLKWDA